MPRESLDAPDDLPEEVLRQASDRLKRQPALTTMAVGRRVWASPGPMLTGGGHAPGSGQRTAFRCRPRPYRWSAGTFACSWSTSSASPVFRRRAVPGVSRGMKGGPPDALLHVAGRIHARDAG